MCSSGNLDFLLIAIIRELIAIIKRKSYFLMKIDRFLFIFFLMVAESDQAHVLTDGSAT
jgi:hypothetical protein